MSNNADIVQVVADIAAGALVSFGIYKLWQQGFFGRRSVSKKKPLLNNSDKLIAAIHAFSTTLQETAAVYQQQANEIGCLLKKRGEEQQPPLTEEQNQLLWVWQESSNALLMHFGSKPNIPESTPTQAEANMTTSELNEYAEAMNTLSEKNMQNYQLLLQSLTHPTALNGLYRNNKL